MRMHEDAVTRASSLFLLLILKDCVSLFHMFSVEMKPYPLETEH